MKTIGWIGLGSMGLPMAENLVSAGFRLKVHNRTKDKALALAGVDVCDSPLQVAAGSDVTFLMLSDGAAVEAVLTGPHGVLEGLGPGKTVIDMSTIAPQDSLRFAQMARERGGLYMDAPVSGSVGAARSAQLVILAGADEAGISEFEICFKALGKATIAFGETGRGSAAKLAINLLLGATAQALGETLVFAQALGVDGGKMRELISQSAMNTPFFQLKRQMYQDNEFPAAFMLALMHKDLGLIADQVAQRHLELPLTAATGKSFEEAMALGLGQQDLAAVYAAIKKKSGLAGENKGKPMELFDALHSRRSIRKYEDRPVPEDVIQKILRAAMMAPSAGDARPWQFILVTDPEKKAKVTTVHPHVGMLARAPLGILICGDLSREKYPGFWPQDCAAAMQNLLLAAHGCGLGAVWTGVYPKEDRVEKMREIFSLPGHIVPMGLAVLGWPAQSISAGDRFDPRMVHANQWDHQ